MLHSNNQSVLLEEFDAPRDPHVDKAKFVLELTPYIGGHRYCGTSNCNRDHQEGFWF